MFMLSSYQQRFHLEILPTWNIFVTLNNTLITKHCVADTIQALLIRHHQFLRLEFHSCLSKSCVCLPATINPVFISFSAIQIYDLQKYSLYSCICTYIFPSRRKVPLKLCRISPFDKFDVFSYVYQEVKNTKINNAV